MLSLSKGQAAQFRFTFINFDGTVYDPANLSTPVDVVVYVLRGETAGGPVISGPFSYLNQDTEETGNRIERVSSGEYIFHYTVPTNLFEHNYSVVARTATATESLTTSLSFQVKKESSTLFPTTIVSPKSSVINYIPSYQQVNSKNTSTVLLLGHADGLEINYPVRIKSIQHAIDLIGADTNSPLLRGVLDAYSCGARDIMICAVAPMIEYIDIYQNKLTSTSLFSLNESTPSSETFYERYYDRLQEAYSQIIDLDFVDIVVPLETSILDTGDVDFITQLATYCSNFHNNSGYVQLGIIGSRTNGIKSSDVSALESNPIFTNKYTTINSVTQQITSDKGRYIIPIYGELVFQHPELKISYTSTAASAMAGMIAASSVNRAIIRSRIPGAISVFGSDLTFSEYERLENIGVNTIYRGSKTRRSTPYECYITNEYTLANSNSVFSKTSQIRLVSLVINEIKSICLSNFDIINYDRIITDTKIFLTTLRNSSTIVDYSFNVDTSEINSGKLIFEIELISALGLRRVNFALAAGPGA